jgi:hypothetical protein
VNTLLIRIFRTFMRLTGYRASPAPHYARFYCGFGITLLLAAIAWIWIAIRFQIVFGLLLFGWLVLSALWVFGQAREESKDDDHP